jgi:CHAT domain-containing protein
MTLKNWLIAGCLVFSSLFVQADTQEELLRLEEQLENFFDEPIRKHETEYFMFSKRRDFRSFNILNENLAAAIIQHYNLIIAKYGQQQVFKAVLPLAEKVFEIATEILGEKHYATLGSRNNLGNLYLALDRLCDALPLFKDNYRFLKEELGEKDPSTLVSLHNLAENYKDLGLLEDSLPLFGECYRLKKEVLSEKHPHTLLTLNSLVENYIKLGRVKEALALAEKAYRFSQEALDEKHLTSIKSLSYLAFIYRELGRLDEALALAEKAYRFSAEVLGETALLTLSNLDNWARIHEYSGQFQQALTLYKKSYRLKTDVLDDQHPELLKNLNCQVAQYAQFGEFESGIPLGYKIFGTAKQIDNPLNLSTKKNSLANFYFQLGRFKEALPLVKNNYELTKEWLGEKHPITLTNLNNLALTYQKLGVLEKALELLKKCYHLRKEVLTEKHPHTLLTLNNLVMTYQELGQFGKALPLAKTSYRLSLEVLGEKHLDTLISMGNLASNYLNSDRLGEALALLEKSYQLYEEVFGKTNLYTLLSLSQLANGYVLAGDFHNGMMLLEKLVRRVEILRRGAFFSTENRQALFKQWVDDYFLFSALELFVRQRPQVAFQLAEMSKARTLLESLATELAAQQSGVSATELQKLQDDEARLAFLNNRIAKALESNRLEEKIRLEAEKNQLQSQLNQFHRQLMAKYPKYAQLREVQIIGAKEGAKYLPADAVLISYLVHQNDVLVFTLQADGKLTGHYFLGAIPNLEEDVEIYRCQLVSFRGKNCQWLLSKEKTPQNSSSSLSDEQESRRGKKRRKRPSAHVQPAESLSRKLGKSLLEPLADIIKNKTHWIISPDGPLALIPFETLHFEGEEQPVIAKHQLNYVQSLSVLKLLQERHKEYQNLKERKTLFAMGAPIYEVEKQTQKWTCAKNKIPNAQLSNGKISNHIGNPNREISTLAENPSAVDFKITRRLVRRGDDYARAFRQLGRGNWENLAGALKEVCELEKLFKDSQPHIYKLEEATEDKLRQLNKQGILAQSRYLVFATHGYLSLQVPALSSVVLGEANNPSSEIDGYVTAAEWTGYNLKSDLMVLSACETGVGQVVSGEGVMGLPYAFYVAGNKNTILTLWEISDGVTAEFVTSFFAKLKAGVGQIEALTATKRDFLAKGGRYSNPKYWAVFVLYGV